MDILEKRNSLIVAPAGCGKTHLICTAIKNKTIIKPILILTHTNAGVESLRDKLKNLDVPLEKYKLHTLDGWMNQICSFFPTRTKISSDILKYAIDSYDKINEAILNLLREKHINNILLASYSYLIVDEYQDCSSLQHQIICSLSEILYTCILGDPLQAIFNFNKNKSPCWKTEVQKVFSLKEGIVTPWRWNNVGAEKFGKWLLEIRNNFLDKIPIDLRSAPSEVKWIKIITEVQNASKEQLVASNIKPIEKNGKILIIGHSKNKNLIYDIAKNIDDASVVEPINLPNLIEFAKDFVPENKDAGRKIIEFIDSLIYFDSSWLKNRNKEYKEIKSLRSDIKQNFSYHKVLYYMKKNKSFKIKIIRTVIYETLIRSLDLYSTGKEMNFLDATIKCRNGNKILPKTSPSRALGSTLLFKGLEADTSIILDADSLKPCELYVAMTRGCKQLIICSKNEILNPF